VHDLVIDRELPTLIIDDEDTHAATAVVERIGEAVKEGALIQHRQPLLDVARLRHGDDAAVVADVEHAVLLEHRAEHVLHDDGRGRVADEAALLVQLLGEEVDAEVAVLARLGRGGDADDLARAALQDEQVADADVVAGDGDGVGDAGATRRVAGRGHAHFALLDDDVFFTRGGAFVVVLVTLVVVLAVDDSVGGAVETVTEGVVVAVLVVISHVKAVLAVLRWVYRALLGDLNLLLEGDGLTLGVALLGVLAGVGALVLPRTGSSVLFGEGGGPLTEVPLGCVEAGVVVDLGRVVPVVDSVFDVDLSVGVPLEGRLVPMMEAWMSVTGR